MKNTLWVIGMCVILVECYILYSRGHEGATNFMLVLFAALLVRGAYVCSPYANQCDEE